MLLFDKWQDCTDRYSSSKKRASTLALWSVMFVLDTESLFKVVRRGSNCTNSLSRKSEASNTSVCKLESLLMATTQGLWVLARSKGSSQKPTEPTSNAPKSGSVASSLSACHKSL